MADEEKQQQSALEQQPKQEEQQQPAQGEQQQQQQGEQKQQEDGEKQEGQQGEQQEEEGGNADGEEGEQADGDDEQAAKKPKRTEPVRLGYRTFNSVEELVHYFKNLLTVAPKNEDLNEYEYLALLDLLKQHPEWDRKAGAGMKAFQVREIDVPDGKARAFFAVHKDGSMEDFSYIKCASQVYPGEVNTHPNASKRSRSEGQGGRGRGRGGRSGGQRGRGGRGGQRGRGGRGGQRGGRGRR